MDDFARAARFATRLENGLAAQLRPWVGGTAVLDPGNPDTWDLNFLRLERAWGVEPAALPPAVEQTARHMGMRTPIVVVPPTADETERLPPHRRRDGAARARACGGGLRARGLRVHGPSGDSGRSGTHRRRARAALRG